MAFKLKKRAQAGLEYLMTYGWALILIATVVGVLVFIVSGPTSNATFSSSNPTKFPVKGGNIANNTLELLLQNITGGAITITGIDYEGDLDEGTYLNGTAFTFGGTWASDDYIEVTAGNELHFTDITVRDKDGDGDYEFTIIVYGKDYANLDFVLTITGLQTGVPSSS